MHVIGGAEVPSVSASRPPEVLGAVVLAAGAIFLPRASDVDVSCAGPDLPLEDTAVI